MLKDIEWIVVPGGPGISKSYLQDPLDRIFEGYKLHYYEQYGSDMTGSGQSITLLNLVEQIYEVADHLRLKCFGIIAHSFGTYLALRALDLDKSRIKAMIFLNPMPLTRPLWHQSLGKISTSVPSHEMARISELSAEVGHDGSELFRLLLPYYTAKTTFMLPHVKFNSKICEELANVVPDYNDFPTVDKLDIPIVSIHGDRDPFYYPGMFPKESSIILEGVGHYPFYEDLLGLKKSINEAESILCQKKTSLKKTLA